MNAGGGASGVFGAGALPLPASRPSSLFQGSSVPQQLRPPFYAPPAPAPPPVSPFPTTSARNATGPGPDGIGRSWLEPGPAPVGSMPTQIVSDFPAPASLRRVRLPARLVPEFLRLSDANSRRAPDGVETCGFLCGREERGELAVCALFVPPQRGSADATEVVSVIEYAAFCERRRLLQLGWIHTHPSQDCFLSAVDVHTHFAFQKDLPEAVAVVVAPRRANAFCAFRVTDAGSVAEGRARGDGMRWVAVCRDPVPHHLEHAGLPGSEGYAFERGGHAVIDAALALEVVDARH